MDDEPAENISGGYGGAGRFAAFDLGEADTRAAAVVAELGDIYWQKTYGGSDAFECLVRTVLSQNTSDVASQPAHDALLERYAPGEETDLARALADLEQQPVFLDIVADRLGVVKLLDRHRLDDVEQRDERPHEEVVDDEHLTAWPRFRCRRSCTVPTGRCTAQ